MVDWVDQIRMNRKRLFYISKLNHFHYLYYIMWKRNSQLRVVLVSNLGNHSIFEYSI